MTLEVTTTVEIHPERVQKQVDEIVNSPTGPVSNLVRQASQKVLTISQGLIGTLYSGHHQAQRLRDSGKVEKGPGSSWVVIYRHPIAKLHEKGSSPHLFPKKDEGFYARSGPGDYTFGPRRGPFTHPGTQPNPYLTNAAQRAGLTLSGALQRGSTLTPLARTSGF